jgi:hypothetical protein
MTYLLQACNKIWGFINSSEVLQLFLENRFFLILCVLVLSALKHKTYRSIILISLINIPGTFLHETAHFLVGFFLNARPTSFTLFPRRSGDAYVMGSVGFKNIKFYNALPSAMAPLLLLVVGFYFNRWFFVNVNLNIWNYFAYVVLQTIIIENALPSSTDFKVAFSNVFGVLFYGILIVTALIFL